MKIPYMIRKRLDGNFYRNYRNLQKYKLSSYSLPIEKLLHQKKKAVLYQYLFSTKFPLCRNYYDSVVSFFDTHYSDMSDPEAYNIDGIRVVKPRREQSLTFGLEATEFLFYYIIDNQELCDAATYEGPYEHGEVRISEGDIVMDCGANIGLFSAIAASKKASVYAFEPDPAIIQAYLSKTAELNCEISVVPFALSDRSGKLCLVQDPNMIKSELVAKTGGGGYFGRCRYAGQIRS